MAQLTSKGQPADFRYRNNGLRAHNFSSLGISPTHSYVSADFKPEFARALQLLRHKVGFDIPVNSAYRSVAYNNAIYRRRGQRPTSNSRHTHGDAIDVNLSSLDENQRRRVLRAALDSGFSAVGFYSGSNMMHLDARQNGTTWGPRPDWASDIMRERWKPGMKPYERDYKLDFADVKTEAPLANLRSSYLTAGDRDTLVRTLLGEAGGEDDRGLEAVAHVIKNRTRDSRWPNTASEVARQPAQFSTWNSLSNGGNRIPHTASETDPNYQRVAQIVDRVFEGKSPDPTDGAVYYYAPKGMPGGRAPDWWSSAVNERGGSTTIGEHRFAGQSRNDTQGQGLNAPNAGRGKAPLTRQVSVEKEIAPNKWSDAQRMNFERNGVKPTITVFEERVVPGSEVEREYRNEQQTSAQLQGRDQPGQGSGTGSNPFGQAPTEPNLVDERNFLGAYLMQLTEQTQASTSNQVMDALVNSGGRNRLTQISPLI